MQKKQFITIIKRSTIALIIPLIGQLFVPGWSWGVGDFIFAWLFFNILGLVYTFVTNKVTSRWGKIAAGILVIGIFATIWVILATG